MELNDLMELAASLSTRLDTHWALFITVHMALLGAIVYVDRPLIRSEKWAAMLIYSGFAIINYYMMRNQLLFIDSLYQDIVAMSSQPCCDSLKSVEYIVNLSQSRGFKVADWAVVVVHLVMFILVLVSILNDKHRSADTLEE